MEKQNQTTLHDPLINLLFDGGLKNALGGFKMLAKQKG